MYPVWVFPYVEVDFEDCAVEIIIGDADSSRECDGNIFSCPVSAFLMCAEKSSYTENDPEIIDCLSELDRIRMFD